MEKSTFIKYQNWLYLFQTMIKINCLEKKTIIETTDEFYDVFF